jgi:hypothetical protein
MRSDKVSYAARTRVKHNPHALLLIQTNLDEVVSGSERSEMPERPQML